ncbi:MAG: hypothetical protein QNL62_24960 [Gammaproteobacteria bacterium]|nr:hypothetical protein [Gammaproteobacteria bacterium]
MNNSTLVRCRLLNNFLFALVSVVVITGFNLPIAVAKGKLDPDRLPLNLELADRFMLQDNTSSSLRVAQQDVLPQEVETFAEITVASNEKGTESDISQEEIKKYKEVSEAANKNRVNKVANQDKTGNDPRVFSNKWTPFYRSTKLSNGMTQQDLTAAGTMRFSDRVGLFYEIPLAQYRDFSDVPGVASGTDAIGMGDIDLKFIWRPEAMDWTFGEGGKKSGSWLFGTDFVLPTATDDALAGNALLFAPIVGAVWDMPFYGFIAMLNIYYVDVYKEASAPDTSRYVGRWFYMQPLSKPGPWYGGLYLMPELQPIYDFETDDAAAWLALEFGKVFAPGRIGYIKPGWGLDNTESTDRNVTFEAGFRWFF